MAFWLLRRSKLRFAGCKNGSRWYTAAFRLPALVRRSEPQENTMPDDNTSASGFQFGLANLKPVETNSIALTFPDGARREFPKNTTGLDIAKGI